MPTGKLTNPDGPGCQGTLGQLKSTEGDVYPFHNTIRFRLDEPVVYDLVDYNATLNGSVQQIFVAIPDPRMNQRNWNQNGFRQRWRGEWANLTDQQIRDFGLVRNGAHLNSVEEVQNVSEEAAFHLDEAN